MESKALRYIGAFIRAHGLRGGLLLRWAPDAPEIEFREGEHIYVGYSAQFVRPYTVRWCQRVPQGLLLGLEEVATRTQAESLLEQGVFVSQERAAAEKEEAGWALEDILGCCVVEESGHVLGTVVDIWLLPANDVWVVETDTSYLPLPVIADVVRQVDLHERRITVRLLPGLLEIAEPKRADEHHELEEGVDAD